MTAIEPNKKILIHRFCKNKYNQIVGGIEQIRRIPSQTYDIIICHNVLEYLNDRKELLYEFSRILKPDGFVSIVKMLNMYNLECAAEEIPEFRNIAFFIILFLSV